MKTYNVTARFSSTGERLPIGQFRAKSATGAILQAVKQLAANGENVCEIIAQESAA